MANHKSATKRAQQNIRRNERNRYYKTRIKNITKNVLSAVEANDKEKAIEEAKKAASELLANPVIENFEIEVK